MIMLTAALVMTAALDGQPDAQLKRLSLEQLGQIEVTSVSKEPEQVWQTPAAIFVLTHDDLIRSGVTSIPDALRLVPGVEVARIDSSRNWVVGIRGFGDQYSRSMLVLIDGRSVYTPLFAGVHWSLQDVILDDVERIEIIRGPGGTVWGANAVNGVINIITRRSEDTQGAEASLQSGNIDEIIASARYGGRLGANGTYRVYGKGFKRGPQWHSDGREFDGWHMGQAGFRGDWTRDHDRWSVQGGAYGGEIGESVLVASFAPPGHTLVDAPAKVNGQNLVARWDRDLGGSSNLMVQAYWDRTDRLGTDFGETRNTFDVDLVHQLRAVGRHSVLWGGGFRLGPATYVQTIEAADFQPHDRAYNLYSGFGQDAITLSSNLTLTAGVKLEHNTYTGLEVQPSVSVLWTPAPHQSLWGAVTRAVRTPSRIDTDISVEQFVAPGPPALYARLVGDPAIRSESLVSVEAGYRVLVGGSAYLDVAAFTHQYTGIVALGAPAIDVPTRGDLTYGRVTFPFANALDGPARGLEIAPSATIAPGVQVRGSYSFLSLDLARRNGVPDTGFSQLLQTGSPRHQVVAQGLLTRGQVEITPTYRFVSDRAAGAIAAYHELDVPMQWTINPAWTLSVVGQNLLHDHHAEWARDPGPTVEIRRAVYVGATWRR
jgi:iron complex outermembrane receptor protein